MCQSCRFTAASCRSLLPISSGWPCLLLFQPELCLSFAPSAKAQRSEPRESSHRALIGVDDLASGGKPDAWSLLHVGDGTLKVFDAQGLTADHGVQRNTHDSRVFAAVGVQRI